MIDGKIIQQNMEEILKVDDSNPLALANQLKDNPNILFYWGSLGERCSTRLHDIEMKFDVWYANKAAKAKEQLLESGEVTKSSITGSIIKNKIIQDNQEEWIKFKDEINRWSYYEGILSKAEKSIKAKNDVLVNLLSFHKEMARNV